MLLKSRFRATKPWLVVLRLPHVSGSTVRPYSAEVFACYYVTRWRSWLRCGLPTFWSEFLLIVQQVGHSSSSSFQRETAVSFRRNPRCPKYRIPSLIQSQGHFFPFLCISMASRYSKESWLTKLTKEIFNCSYKKKNNTLLDEKMKKIRKKYELMKK